MGSLRSFSICNYLEAWRVSKWHVSFASPGDMCLVFPGFDDGAFDAPSTSDVISRGLERPSTSPFPLPRRLRLRLLRLADSFLWNEWRYDVGHCQNEGSSVMRVMPPPTRISVASGLHPQWITDFNYSGGTFKLTREGDALSRVSTASGLYPQPIVDFNYGGGVFKLAHEGDAVIRESRWPPARIPNSEI
jgi:hypothetical protein